MRSNDDTDSVLEQRLRRAPSYPAWVETLAAYFDEYGLVFGHGTDNAGDEAYWLVAHLLEWRQDLWSGPPDAKLAPAAAALAGRRVRERKPLAYLLGEAWFADLRFKVDERVLVPRSPLAEVIEACFAPWCRLEEGDRILDIGTGSGCLAIAAAYHCPGVSVDATDVSVEALALAAENVALHGLEARVRLIETDLFPSEGGPYRVIMSNPPYVPDEQMRGLPPEYAHEPVSGLAAGPTGLEPAERVLAGAVDRLQPGGIVIVEVGGGQEAFMDAHPRLPATWIELERGGEGVFVVTADELRDYLAAAGSE
jgi:ribosomal protein L3 glutamine methyltransferase